MAINKSDHRLEQVSFLFDGAGDVKEVVLQVNYALRDDATGQEEARVRWSVSVWAGLSQGQKDSANSVGKMLNSLAQTV
ncbi:MAG: hypothetical protein FJ320_12290 [SAR202 cluster bacterium]|nr:hypothetical protein [SAR202 cluster bacterium]